MNKIKIIYDVVRKMKDKEFLKVTFKAAGMKDQEKMFSISNTFERSIKEADSQGGGCCGHHGFMRHMHPDHNHQHGLNRILCVLGILSSIKLEEKEDKSAVLSLESADIPEEISRDIQDMMKCHHENHKHHMFMKEFHDMEKVDFALKIFINKDKEIEIATINISGEKQDEKNERHEIKMSAEMQFE